MANASDTTLTHDQRRERRREIATAVRDGLDAAGAATRFGVSIELIRRACRENGVALRTTKVPASAFALLFRLLAGERRAAIAVSAGVTRQYVAHIKATAEAAGFRFERSDAA